MHKIGTPLIVLAVLFAVASFVPLPMFDVVTSDHSVNATIKEVDVSYGGEASLSESEPPADTRPVIKHVPLPEPVKAIYMTSCVAGTPTFRVKLIELIRETEVNAVVIDVKDYSGTISFPPQSEAWKPAWQEARCGTSDMQQLIALLHDHNIFTIARITVFQDPFYAPKHPKLAVLRSDRSTVWEDDKGLSFIDVAARPVLGSYY
jgi:hypothetical protein